MQLKHIAMGVCQLDLYASELALFTLIMRDASSSNELLCLNPLMVTTLDSLALTLQQAALVSLQQEGSVPAVDGKPLTSEEIYAICEAVIQRGLVHREELAAITTDGSPL